MEINYCYGCMASLRPGQTVCPYCGHDNSVYLNGSSFLREGMILKGKYMVGLVLGRGGFGITYIGIDLVGKEKVAIKEYFPISVCIRNSSFQPVQIVSGSVGIKGFQKGQKAFLQEARILSVFSSPYIAYIRDFFLENNTSYIVMDYVEGIGLDQAILKNGGRLPWQKVVSLSKALMPVLDQIHQKNLLHRDIKPQNIRITKDKNTGEERFVLLDFGSARSFVSASLTGIYTAVLTPGYAPIEQYQRESHQGPYTDVYGLCATMYKSITGSLPPPAPELFLGEERIEPFNRFGLNIPADVEKAVMHGLALRSKDRPQTMMKLLAEFPRENESAAGRLFRPQPAVPNYHNGQGALGSAHRSPALTKGGIFRFGRFPQKNRSDPSEIEWLVLAMDSRRALVISRYGMDAKGYHDSTIPVTWRTCRLRKWLEEYFYAYAFNAQEKKRILQVRNHNPDNQKYSSRGGEDTWDRLFLLSIDEANRYFSSDAAQMCTSTAYAKVHNVNVFTSHDRSWWWLRSPGYDNKYAAYVMAGGSVNSYGLIVSSFIGAVRPAFWLDLTK